MKAFLLTLYRPIQWIYLHYFLLKLKNKCPIHALKKHGYIVSASGTGKSELIKLLVYREIKKRKPKESIIVIDPHGDLVDEIARSSCFKSPKQASKRLVYIDPGATHAYFPCINPFKLEKHTEKHIALMTSELTSILSVLLQKAGTTNQMDALLSPCIATLLRRKNSDLSDLQRFMDNQFNQDLVLLGQQSPNPHHKRFFLHSFHNALYTATKHGIATRLQVLLNEPVFQQLISTHTSFDLKKLINQKKIILFKLSLGESGSNSIESYGRFIVGMLRMIALQRSNLPKQYRIPIYLFIDEFQNFISDDIEKGLTQLRKYGLHFILSNQYIGQKVSPEIQKALFSCHVKIAGRNDNKSLKALSNEMDIPSEHFKQLPIGSFYLKKGIYPVQKLCTPKYLLNNNGQMADKDWQTLLLKNIKHYYLPLNHHD